MKPSDSDLSLHISKDGTATLYSEYFGQHYHSMHGALQESEHVFIKHGLDRVKLKSLKVLELGFGSGLNALLTLRESHKRELNIDYHGIELYPADVDQVMKLNYPEQLNLFNLQESFKSMHTKPWNAWSPIEKNFKLKKSQEDFRTADFESNYDLVYFDAFGPGTQPELWKFEIFERLYNSMSNGGVLTTYSCKGDVRRAMISLGFDVEKPIGPPGKRSMLVATK